MRKQGWTYKKLGEVVRFMADGDWIESKDQSKNGIRLIQTGNIGNGIFKLKEDKAHFITEETMSRLGCTEIFEGDCLVSRLPEPVGRACIIPSTGHRMITAVDCSIIRFKNECLSRFFIYYTQCSKYLNCVNDYITGTTRKRISRKNLEKIIVPVPSMEEQGRIVARLDAAFAQIDELRANAEKQLEEARALFNAALNEEMKPKKGWEEKKLKEIGLTQTGTTPSKSVASNYGDFIPFIRPSEIDYDGCGNINYNSEMRLSETGLANGRLFKKNSILMVCIGATISKVGFTIKDISCNQQINVLYPYNDYYYKFIYYAMRSDDFKNKVVKEGTSAQATLPIINKSKWENLSFCLPDSLSEQEAIVERLDVLSERVKELEEIARTTVKECDALKQSILRETFE